MNILDSFFPRPAYRPEAALYFVHVPKCAGTSVRLMVENAFDGTRTYPCGSRLFTGNYIEIEDHLEAKEDLRGFQILTSHSGALLLPSLAPDVNLFTWLRHPRDRAISYFFFYYLEGIWPDSREKDFRTRVNAGERLETVFMDSLRLYPPGYCPYIKEAVGLRPHTEIYWSQMYPDRDPHEFMQELLRRYFFVGLMEDHERSIDLFCALTGILPPRRQIRRNVGTKRPQALNFTPAEEEEFNEYLRGDIELYELAANIYHRQWDELVQWKDTNPALGFIGDREGLRACLLERSVRKGKIPGLGRWRAWDAVWGENLDSREQGPEGEGGKDRRWRWTSPLPETCLFFTIPNRAQAQILRLLLDRATPPEHMREVQLSLNGRPCPLFPPRRVGDDWVIEGILPRGTLAELPELVELELYTPSMLDESLIPGRGLRRLGVALAGIEVIPLIS